MTINVTSTNQNIVFVTSGTHNGNYGGLAGANAFCNSAAAAAGVPGGFAAFLGTSTATPYAALGSARGWIRPDGMPFTDTVAGFQNSQIMWYPAVMNELGATPAVSYFTGTNATATCTDWTTADANAVLTNGGEGSEGAYFTSINAYSCAQSLSLVCFGTNFTTPVSVTPAAGRHVFSSGGFLAANAGIAGADALCQSEATAASLANPTHFLAALPTTTASAASRFNLAGATWVRTDGVLTAATTADFMAGKLIAPPSPDAAGVILGSQGWMGSKGGMTAPPVNAATENCNNWSSNSSVQTAVIEEPIFGGPDVPDAFTTFAGAALPCNFSLTVLCLEN
jgi:hypothetical protein